MQEKKRYVEEIGRLLEGIEACSRGELERVDYLEMYRMACKVEAYMDLLIPNPSKDGGSEMSRIESIEEELSKGMVYCGWLSSVEKRGKSLGIGIKAFELKEMVYRLYGHVQEEVE